jgi:hypothetical protein
LFRNRTVSLGTEKNGGRLFRRPKLTLSCSAEEKEGRKEGRKVILTAFNETGYECHVTGRHTL